MQLFSDKKDESGLAFSVKSPQLKLLAVSPGEIYEVINLNMKRYITIVNVLLITAAIYFSVKAFYKISTPRLDDVHSSATTAKKSLSADNRIHPPLSFYSNIAKRNLFNTTKEPGHDSAQAVIEDLKPTELKLRLWGTVTGDTDKAYAVIEETQGKKQDLYRVGDTIQDATIKRILRAKVVLNVNGKDEILALEDLEPGNKKVVFPTMPTKAHSSNVKVKHFQITDAIKNVNNLMGQVRVRPYFENGKPAGISLSSIRPDSIFKKMGLINGDIIKGVDGKEIESVDDVLGFYSDLKSAGNIQLQIKRRGRLQTIDYTIE